MTHDHHVPDAIVLCVRDPDADNEFTTDGDVRVIDIDLGRGFDGLDDICAEGVEQAREYVAGWLAQVADLPRESHVRLTVEAIADQANDIIGRTP